eukprot:gb/GFBE01025541.1/.p1 GENE.gb/GFBE01025541.1/~~gb/GFBE01025541.1/.p1  ORF type:complete len:558 (+),score=100.61 gb/GFBE01025541.1/:1-1674(+)
MPANRTLCPANLDSHGDVAATCVVDESCTCANASHVRELVNVTFDGLACYACEPRRPPACTEASDQCTPEACECANPVTHTKHAATTVDGSPCHYCEPINGVGNSLGRPEVMMVVLVFVLLLLWQFMGRKPAPGGRGSLRLSRRQGDRNKAIRVHQEPLRFYEEILLTLGDAFDILVDGACELLGAAWSLIRRVFALLSSAMAWMLEVADSILGRSCAFLRSCAQASMAFCSFSSSQKPKPPKGQPKAARASAVGQAQQKTVRASAPGPIQSAPAAPAAPAVATTASFTSYTSSTSSTSSRKDSETVTDSATRDSAASEQAATAVRAHPSKSSAIKRCAAKAVPSCKTEERGPSSPSVKSSCAGSPSVRSSPAQLAQPAQTVPRGALPQPSAKPKDKKGKSAGQTKVGAHDLNALPSPVYKAALAVMKADATAVSTGVSDCPDLPPFTLQTSRPEDFDEGSTDGEVAGNSTAIDDAETASSGDREDDIGQETFLRADSAAEAAAILAAAPDRRAAALQLLDSVPMPAVEVRTFLVEPEVEAPVMRRTVSDSDIALYC